MQAYTIWEKGELVQSPFPGMYAGIKTGKIFGRLTCKSGMRAKKENRIFFHFWEDAVKAGFRPCKNCKPEKFSRADCAHMPFGLTGGLALNVRETTRGKIRITCALCGKFLGYATEDGLFEGGSILAFSFCPLPIFALEFIWNLTPHGNNFMPKYFDEQKWLEAIKHDDWYLRLSDDYKRLMRKTEESNSEVAKEIKEEIYQFFESHLAKNDVVLGKEGPNWDEARKPIDTIVIHHTKNQPGITWQRLSAMQLVRLYATYYAAPYYEKEKSIKGEAIFSNHFRNGQQVFYTYHWLVRMDGSAERLLNDNEIGWQAGKWEVNCRSVAICLDNDFESSSPSDSVIASVAKLIKEKYSQVKAENIIGHREVNPKTTCPGNEFLYGWKLKLTATLQ